MVLLNSTLTFIILAMLIASITIIIVVEIAKKGFKDGSQYTLKDIKDIFYPSWWSVALLVLLLIFNVAALGASIDDAVNDKIENYRKGNVSRIVNYKVKTIDGKTTVTDSTYYYRDKKRN